MVESGVATPISGGIDMGVLFFEGGLILFNGFMNNGFPIDAVRLSLRLPRFLLVIEQEICQVASFVYS